MAKRGPLSGLSSTELQAELRRRERHVGSLIKRRDRLAAKIEQLDSMIEELGGPSGGSRGGIAGGRKRPKNEMNLVEALRKTLAGKTMSVTEVAEAVQRAGYKTSAANFRTIVNQTLINSGEFKRVSRGQYTAK